MSWKIVGVGISISIFLLSCASDERVTIYCKEKIVTIRQSRLEDKLRTFKPYDNLVITRRNNSEVLLLSVNPDLEYGILTQGSRIEVIKLDNIDDYFNTREIEPK